MGCFNKMGFISHLPITYDEDIVLFICGDVTALREENTKFACGSISPLFLPLRGKYDDYGGIYDIIRDENVEYIEKTIGLTIEEITSAIYRNGGTSLHMMKENQKDEDVSNNKFLSSLKKLDDDYIHTLEVITSHINLYTIATDRVCLYYTMEHARVYDKMVELYDDNPFSQKYDSTIEKLKKYINLTTINIFDPYARENYENKLHETLEKINDGEDYDKEFVNQLTTDSLSKLKIDTILQELNISNPLRNTWVALKGYNSFGFDWERNAESIKSFMAFCYGMALMCLCFEISVYGNQQVEDELDSFKALNQLYLQIIEEKEQKKLED